MFKRIVNVVIISMLLFISFSSVIFAEECDEQNPSIVPVPSPGDPVNDVELTSSTEVSVTVISEDADLDVNVAANNASISLNGISTTGATINGVQIATVNNTKGKADRESIFELRRVDKELSATDQRLWTAIEQLAAQSGLTQQAVVKLINQDPLLHTRLLNLEEDSTEYFQNIYALYAHINSLQQEVDVLKIQNENLRDLLEEQNIINQAAQLRLENEVQTLRAATLDQKQSGFVYTVRNVLSRIRTFLCIGLR